MEEILKKIDTKEAVALGVVLINMTYLISIYAFTMKTRWAIYRRKFMRDFDKVHLEAVPTDKKAPMDGYPDTGSGWYSQSLPYKEWFQMACAQRVQLNFHE